MCFWGGIGDQLPRNLNRCWLHTLIPAFVYSHLYMCWSCSVYLPVRHGLKLQGLFSKRSPTQGFPPGPGGGLSHRRVLMLFPGPHDALHALQSLQFPHPPLTTTSKKFNQIEGLFLFLKGPLLPAPGSPLLNFSMLTDRAIFV